MKRVVCLCVILLSGCALKQYPQLPEVSDAEVQAYDCQALQAQIVKTREVQQQIATTGKFDALTVVGFFIDLGIGNGVAKANANRRATTRLQQLEALQAVRCPATAAAASLHSAH